MVPIESVTIQYIVFYKVHFFKATVINNNGITLFQNCLRKKSPNFIPISLKIKKFFSILKILGPEFRVLQIRIVSLCFTCKYTFCVQYTVLFFTIEV